MTAYKHILVAIDLIDDYRTVLQKALTLRDESCRLSIMHCIEPIPYTDNYAGGLEAKVMEKTLEYATSEVAKVVAEMKIEIDPEDVVVETGRPGREIHDYAVENGVDLVVVGSHGKHGLQLLFGSTSSTVLHHAVYDVLAVSLKKE